MRVKIQAAAEVGMPREDNWKHLDRIVKAEDGLGLCRFCKDCDKTNLPEQIALGTDSYYAAFCQHKAQPCYKVRRSLITCPYFKSPLNPKKTPFYIRLIASICEMDGTLLRENHQRWNMPRSTNEL